LLVLMPHPDDIEYGTAAAVAKWTAAGRAVRYALACRGEAGIAGMPPDEAGPLREAEQRRAAAIVGVDEVDFWDFPDSAIANTAALRAKIGSVIAETRPDVVVTIYGGRQFGPDAPNQPDHIQFAAAVTTAYDELSDPPRWLFQAGPEPTHAETVDGYVDVAVSALAAHDVYLSVLDPHTPVREQARKIIDMTVPAAPESGVRAVGFILQRNPR
jgi:LmbE family N-acetylglucosaminyl deacetylase